MVANKHDILKQALELSDADRVELTAALTDSLDPHRVDEVGQAWLAECVARRAAWQRGEIGATPADEVFAKLRQR